MAQQSGPPAYNMAQNYPASYDQTQDPYKNAAAGAYGPPPPQSGFAPLPQSGYAPPPQSGYAPPPQPGYAPSHQYGGYGRVSPQAYGSPGTGYSNPTAYDARGSDNSEPAVPKATDDSGMFSAAFSDKAIRRGFIKKVYLILFSQLLVTFGIICLFIFVEPVKNWVQNDGLWFYICAYATFLVLYIALVCCPSVRKKYPGNFICLGIFTLAFSYLTATISSFHDTGIVLMAAGITAAVCLAISIFAMQTKIDFTMCSGLLFVLVMVFFFFGWACLITNLTWGTSHILNCVYGGLAALVFGLFLIYDTQQVMGGRKYELSPEEYIYGALQLYIDVVYIFIIILGFMGKSN
ncbi:protein lifeguard 2 [Aplysia californica]|uniref:Protein lifeguard 2 n=1 Tax=Aplysia californica TaxID=6500 RepID=A0ABM1VU63_APLCA|nr:protein lifeguard 2 [Aplysia californica]